MNTHDAIGDMDIAMRFSHQKADADKWLHLQLLAESAEKLTGLVDGVLSHAAESGGAFSVMQRLEAALMLQSADAVKEHATCPEGRSVSEHSRYVDTALANAADALVEYWSSH